MNTIKIVIVLLVIALVNPIFAETRKQPSTRIVDLENEVARLKAELAACQNAKKSASNTQRDEAIASLRAIRSALGTGANLQEFKKYQIESRIKIDALPDTPENRILKEISDIYKDAVSFSIMQMTGDISSSELELARIKYKDGDKLLVECLSKMTPDETGKYDLKRNQVYAEYASKALILKADSMFSELK
jgi:hypothetical protein